MKKYINKKSLFALSMAVVMTSCDMDAPTQSSMDSSSIFSQYSLAKDAVNGILVSFGETNSYRGRFIPYYGVNSDIEWMNGADATKLPDGGKNDLVAYNTTPTNTQMNTDNNAYAKFYEGIERANMAIEGLRTYGNIENDEQMAYLLGVALTYRAVLYFDLIKGWGDVPARWEPISTETMYAERTDRDSIYVHLLNDLEEAENYCPWPNNTLTSKVTDVSKSFVKGLKARIALCAGGYSYRQDKTIRLSNSEELSPKKMYTLALQECDDVINSGSNSLETSFEQIFRRLCKDDESAGNESLWEIPFSDGRGRVLYTWGIQHQTKDQYTNLAKGGVNGPVPTLYYDYDVKDKRRDVTCVPYVWSKDGTDYTVTSNGTTYNVKKTYQELSKLYKWCFGKLRFEWMDRYVTSSNDDGINFQYMRLADVYLMAAEAANALGNTEDAWKYMEPVLSRAFSDKSKVSALQAKYTASQEAFFEGVVEQRAFEFAGEQLRKEDLIRWNMLGEKLAEAKAAMIELRTRQGDYADLPVNLYFKLMDDGETLDIYGLDHGDTDEYGNTLVETQGYSSQKWISEDGLDDKYVNGLYYSSNNPDEHQYWPIWQTFIDASNGALNNSWLGY